MITRDQQVIATISDYINSNREDHLLGYLENMKIDPTIVKVDGQSLRMKAIQQHFTVLTNKITQIYFSQIEYSMSNMPFSHTKAIAIDAINEGVFSQPQPLPARLLALSIEHEPDFDLGTMIVDTGIDVNDNTLNSPTPLLLLAVNKPNLRAVRRLIQADAYPSTIAQTLRDAGNNERVNTIKNIIIERTNQICDAAVENIDAIKASLWFDFSTNIFSSYLSEYMFGSLGKMVTLMDRLTTFIKENDSTEDVLEKLNRFEGFAEVYERTMNYLNINKKPGYLRNRFDGFKVDKKTVFFDSCGELIRLALNKEDDRVIIRLFDLNLITFSDIPFSYHGGMPEFINQLYIKRHTFKDFIAKLKDAEFSVDSHHYFIKGCIQSPRLASQMLKMGLVDPNDDAGYMMNGIMHAALSGHTELVCQLLDLNVNLTQTTKHFKQKFVVGGFGNIGYYDDMKTIGLSMFTRLDHSYHLSSVEFTNEGEFGYTLLHLAVIGGDLAMVQAILNKKNDLINSRSLRGFTPLMEAAHANKIDILRYLLERGADMTIKNQNSLGVLEFEVARNANHQIITLLIDKAIKSQLDTLLQQPAKYALPELKEKVLDMITSEFNGTAFGCSVAQLKTKMRVAVNNIVTQLTAMPAYANILVVPGDAEEMSSDTDIEDEYQPKRLRLM